MQYRDELINCFANKGKLETLYGILKSWPVQDLLWEYKKNIINSDELFCQFQSKYFISHEAKILINRIIYLTTMYNSTFEQFYNSITFSNEIYRKLSIDQFVDLLKCSEFNDYLNNSSIINSLLYFTTILGNTKVKNAIKNAIKQTAIDEKTITWIISSLNKNKYNINLQKEFDTNLQEQILQIEHKLKIENQQKIIQQSEPNINLIDKLIKQIANQFYCLFRSVELDKQI